MGGGAVAYREAAACGWVCGDVELDGAIAGGWMEWWSWMMLLGIGAAGDCRFWEYVLLQLSAPGHNYFRGLALLGTCSRVS